MNDDQIKNTLDEIQSRIYSATSPADLAKLSMAASGLLSFTNSPEIENRVKAIEAAVEKRTDEVESSISSQNVSSGAKAGYDKDGDKDLDPIAKAATKIYEKFRLTSKEELANKKKDTLYLSELEEAMKAGKPVSEGLKKKLKKTPEQIKITKERNQQMVEAEKVARAEAEMRAQEIKKLKTEIEKLPPHKHKEIQAQISQHTTRHVEALSVMGAIHEHYDEHLKHAKSIYNAKEAAKKSGVDQAVFNDIEEQFVESVTVAMMERLVKYAEDRGNDNTAHVQWLKSKQVQEEVMQDPEVTNAIMNALKKQQNKHQDKLASPLSPDSTPGVKAATSNKGHGGHGI